MFPGMVAPNSGWGQPPPKPQGPLSALVFCHVCGCTYIDRCPLHDVASVTLKPGRGGFVIGETAGEFARNK